MTSGNAGRTTAWIKAVAAAGMGLLASCGNNIAPLRPAWQQDPNLFHQGFPAYQAQTTTTPHMVARVVYATPERIAQMMERQGDVPDAQRGLARMGDGTLDLGVQDVASGKWIPSYLCGGSLFVGGLPNQAYRIVLKNRTPMPLQLGVGVDGKDIETGKAASLGRGGLRMPKHGSLVLDHAARGPLLFKAGTSDAVLFDSSPQGRLGLIQLAVFLDSEAPSIGPEKLRPSQIAPLGLFPIGRPEQYR
ncbi:hypothetical protein [Prosthecobacter sp.]|uniref:hypothetical protein n=1 Tax=Prosthecobacter sp. TaxID=1965333 RepID=UPI00378468B1